MTLSPDYWKTQAHAVQQALLADLMPLINIESVYDENAASPEAPFGPGPRAALDYMLDLARRDGFDTDDIDHVDGVIRFGEGEKILGLLCHLDVVPATGEWTSPAFEATIRNGRLWGRGTSDDKGPALACYYALKLLRDAGVTPNMQIHFILGTDEENGWRCMERYFESAPMPDMAFSPDADFPLINGEKGVIDLPVHILAEGTENASDGTLLSFGGGIRTNIVPEHAYARIVTNNTDALANAWVDYLATCEATGAADEDGDILILICDGRSAHGAEPECGLNAATTLANFLARYDFGAANPFLRFLGEVLHEDFTGEQLGIAVHDEVMGKTSVNPGIISYEAGVGDIRLNIRHPRGTDAETILSQLHARFGDIICEPESVKQVHFVAPDDTLVKSLLDVYSEHTGNPGQALSIGGITYAHVIPHGVAFGMIMPDSDVVIHQPDESLVLSDLEAATAIYADAIYRLVK